MITKIITQEKVERIRRYIERGERFVILSHTSPDGDAIGASLGLFHYLTAINKIVTVIIPDEMPVCLRWLKGTKDILTCKKYPDYCAQLIKEADVIFCLDFNSPIRLGELGALLSSAQGKKVLIDHHPDPDPMFNVSISYPQISSTSELIFRLICQMGDFEQITKVGAEAIYTGMMTDTGGFTFNSNSSEIYFIISELIKKGINKDWIYSRIYNTFSEGRMRLMGYTLYEKMKLFPDCGTALLVLSEEEMKRFDYKNGDTEGFVNLPMCIDGIIFSVFIREMRRVIKLSFRSLGGFPSNLMASEHFNGGGHTNASGGEFDGSLEDAVALFEKILPNYKALLQKAMGQRNKRDE